MVDGYGIIISAASIWWGDFIGNNSAAKLTNEPNNQQHTQLVYYWEADSHQATEEIPNLLKSDV